MKGKLSNDRGISTIQTSAFNYGGEKHDVIDIAEAREILDYDVLVKACKTQEGEDIAGINYLVNSRDNCVIPSLGVGDRFVPYQNHDFFDYFTQDIMPQIPDLKLETVATLHGTGTAFITTNFGDDFKVKGDESPNKFRMLFSNDNTGKSSLLLGFTSVRVVCMNTLAMARKEVGHDEESFKVRHTETVNSRVGEAVRVIYAKLRALSEMKARIDALANKEVSPEMVQKTLNRIYNQNAFERGSTGFTKLENKRTEVIRQFESGETAQTMTNKSAWALFNAYTFPIFNPKTEKKNSDRAEIAYRGSVGNVADRVSKIFNIIEEEAGVRIAA